MSEDGTSEGSAKAGGRTTTCDEPRPESPSYEEDEASCWEQVGSCSGPKSATCDDVERQTASFVVDPSELMQSDASEGLRDYPSGQLCSRELVAREDEVNVQQVAHGDEVNGQLAESFRLHCETEFSAESFTKVQVPSVLSCREAIKCKHSSEPDSVSEKKGRLIIKGARKLQKLDETVSSTSQKLSKVTDRRSEDDDRRTSDVASDSFSSESSSSSLVSSSSSGVSLQCEPAAAPVMDYVVRCLKDYGFCVVDNFMGVRAGCKILRDVHACSDKLRAGRLMAADVESREVRGDETMWLEEGISRDVDRFVRRLDVMVPHLGPRLGPYQISSRTKAMVARYPGEGQCYAKHIDNHKQDGRSITCIYYLNQHYNAETDGGLLRMYPIQLDRHIDVEPKFDRVIFFWSDQRTPHEVRPAFRERYAITVWYFDEAERRKARDRMSAAGKIRDDSNAKVLSPVLLNCE